MGALWEELFECLEPVHASSPQADCLCVFMLAPVQVNPMSPYSLEDTAGLRGWESCSSPRPGPPLSPHTVPGRCWDMELLGCAQCRLWPRGVLGGPWRWPGL